MPAERSRQYIRDMLGLNSDPRSPGSTALTRTPFGASSKARFFVSASWAALATLYAGFPPRGIWEPIDPMFTTAPCRYACPGSAARAEKVEPTLPAGVKHCQLSLALSCSCITQLLAILSCVKPAPRQSQHIAAAIHMRKRHTLFWISCSLEARTRAKQLVTCSCTCTAPQLCWWQPHAHWRAHHMPHRNPFTSYHHCTCSKQAVRPVGSHLPCLSKVCQRLCSFYRACQGL